LIRSSKGSHLNQELTYFEQTAGLHISMHDKYVKIVTVSAQ